MLGKASEISITNALCRPDAVREWLKDHPNTIILNITTTETDGEDYFYIIYREGESNG